jgi:hypothetical protein
LSQPDAESLGGFGKVGWQRWLPIRYAAGNEYEVV